MRILQAAILVSCLTVTSAAAGVVTYTADLTGAAESPANASPGTGRAFVEANDVAHTLHVFVTFSDLLAPNTASHIHCCTAVPFTSTAAVATTTPTFPGFPDGTTSGTYDRVLDMTLASSWRAGYLAGFGGSTFAAEAALLAGLAEGKAYLNIHSQLYPGGEIRGFLVPTPEPGTWLMAGAALAGLALRKRSRR